MHPAAAYLKTVIAELIADAVVAVAAVAMAAVTDAVTTVIATRNRVCLGP
jgi:hypothetical protein